MIIAETVWNVTNCGKKKEWIVDMKTLVLIPQDNKVSATTTYDKQLGVKLRKIHERLLNIIADVLFTHDQSSKYFVLIELTKEDFVKHIRNKSCGWLGTTSQPFKLVSTILTQ